MSQQINVIGKAPFMMYPINKQSIYSYYKNSPEIVLEFAPTQNRLCKSSSMRIVGKLTIKNKDGSEVLPANRFDTVSNTNDNIINGCEKVVYINEKIGCNGFVSNMTIGPMNGGVYEQARYYNRVLANTVPVQSSYQDMCASLQLLMSGYPNNDMISRECGGPIEFALPLTSGYIQSNPMTTLDRGLSIKLDLASDAQFLLGASASDFYYELSDFSLIGDYLMLSGNLKNTGGQYTAIQSFSNVINSSNTHNNVPMALSAVSTIFQSYIPSAWTNNPYYDAFSLCKMLNKSGNSDYTETDGIDIITFNRGAIRFPLSYEVDERLQNTNDSFQTVRSRQYLDSIESYAGNTDSLICPETEVVPGMVTKRTNDLQTPAYPDGGMQLRWTKNAGEFHRNGPIEASKYIYGYGNKQDRLNSGIYANYQNASFNYSLTSQLDNVSTQVYTFATSVTNVDTSKSGQVMAVN